MANLGLIRTLDGLVRTYIYYIVYYLWTDKDFGWTGAKGMRREYVWTDRGVFIELITEVKYE